MAGKTSVRLVVLLSVSALAIRAQSFSFGIKAGVPLTGFFGGSGTAQYPYTSDTSRYLIGPTVELRLPFGLGVEFDALYRQYSYAGLGFTPAPGIHLQYSAENAGAGAWEFPLLAKYRFPSKVVRPFVDAGIAWNTLSGLSATVCAINCGDTSSPPSLRHSTVTGFVAGAGIDAHLLFLHFSPEIRYTRWGAAMFQAPTGGFSSRQNQAEFLLGITF